VGEGATPRIEALQGHEASRGAGWLQAPAPFARPIKPDVDEIMGRLSDAISVVATAANALLGAQEREGSTAGAEVGDEITTLLHGVRCIRRAYDALDVAVREARAWAAETLRK
jgi:hypothetical protein